MVKSYKLAISISLTKEKFIVEVHPQHTIQDVIQVIKAHYKKQHLDLDQLAFQKLGTKRFSLIFSRKGRKNEEEWIQKTGKPIEGDENEQELEDGKLQLPKIHLISKSNTKKLSLNNNESVNEEHINQQQDNNLKNVSTIEFEENNTIQSTNGNENSEVKPVHSQDEQKRQLGNLMSDLDQQH